MSATNAVDGAVADGAVQRSVRVLLFGVLRERLGSCEITVPVTAHDTMSGVWERVTSHHRISRDAIRCARNLDYCGWDDPVHAGDELAFLPPVCGGSGITDGESVAVRVTRDPIDVAALLAGAGGDGDGAVACFIGRVRGESDGVRVHTLEYEAYEPMAVAVMQRIADAVRQRHGLSAIAAVHRVGMLGVGEVAVAVVTASPHRDAALQACREAIDAVKHDAPIWKREHTAAGATWVDARELSTSSV